MTTDWRRHGQTAFILVAAVLLVIAALLTTPSDQLDGPLLWLRERLMR